MKMFCLKYLIKISVLALAFAPLMIAQVTDTIHVHSGWNMVSLPLSVDDTYYLNIFPTATSKPFNFIFDMGYLESDHKLIIGYGYWLKFDSPQTLTLSGYPIFQANVDLYTGWNMFGTISHDVSISQITTQPKDIVISDFYNYQDGFYYSVDSLRSGYGYWIKIKQPGKLILSSMDIPCLGTPTVEYGGKTYNTVQIGSQCWLKENLDIGVMIQGTDTAKDNGIVEKYCYNNDTSNCNIYGGFYQWNEVMQYTTTEGAQGICPDGWHLPTNTEFQTLSTLVGANSNSLKAIGQGTGDGTGTNTSGFSALLAGYRIYDGFFYNLSYYVSFWSSTEYGPYAYYITLLHNSSFIYLYYFTYKDYGFSIRCIKDE